MSTKVSFSIIAILLFTTVYSFRNTNKYKIDNAVLKKENIELKHFSDSLYYELVPIQNELNRYYLAFEIFLNRNHKAAEQFGNIISDETE